MAVVERLLELAVCDACGKARPKAADAPYPDGFYGDVAEVAGGQSTENTQWHACRAAHIKAAILAAIQRALTDEG